MRTQIVPVGIAMILFASCTVKDNDEPPTETAIPSGVTYEVIETDTLGTIKRSVDVRLNQRVSQDTLRALALVIRDQDSRDHDRTFITYFLPETENGSGAWATTHFDPDLEVQILGFTVAEAEALSEPQPVTEGLQLIGVWLDERPGVG